jgi:hypothetical protein
VELGALSLELEVEPELEVVEFLAVCVPPGNTKLHVGSAEQGKGPAVLVQVVVCPVKVTEAGQLVIVIVVAVTVLLPCDTMVVDAVDVDCGGKVPVVDNGAADDGEEENDSPVDGETEVEEFDEEEESEVDTGQRASSIVV